MTYVDWMIRGTKLAACSCDYGCPCEFNAPPTLDVCEGLEAMAIEAGYFGDVRLDGLRFAATYRWPGPVHLGGGAALGVIDEAATDAQREALFKILSGEEQEPTTLFNIYGSTIAIEHEPVFAPIEMEWDYEARTGRVVIPAVATLDLEPIRNPVTGEPHRAQIRLPEGFEFHEAEVASATFSSSGPIGMDRRAKYGALCRVAYGPYGIIETAAAAAPALAS